MGLCCQVAKSPEGQVFRCNQGVVKVYSEKSSQFIQPKHSKSDTNTIIPSFKSQPDFVAALMQFTSSLNAHQLSDAELGLFSGAVLLSERPGLNDVKAVQRLQDRLLEALRIQGGRNHSSGISAVGCPGVIGIAQRIPELRALGLRHANLLDWFRRNWTKLKLPPLFAEIFDIPKCEEDLQ